MPMLAGNATVCHLRYRLHGCSLRSQFLRFVSFTIDVFHPFDFIITIAFVSFFSSLLFYSSKVRDVYNLATINRVELRDKHKKIRRE